MMQVGSLRVDWHRWIRFTYVNQLGDCPLASDKQSIIIVTYAFSDTINDKSWRLLQRKVYGYLATGLGTKAFK